ncbi:MAG: riboflavin synthase [Candidatus Omnitrophota bacterium]
MFTGIIKELGIVKNVGRRGNLTLLEVKSKAALNGVGVGDSVAVNGACLTVVKKDSDSMAFDVMPETMRLTNLGKLRIGQRVNLEPALKVGDSLSGHFVLGHIDGQALIRRKAFTGNNLCYGIDIPSGLGKYIVNKGSVAVDGISLTVAEVRGRQFSAYIIPRTLTNTTLNYKNIGAAVNIEIDVLARYCFINP